MSDYFEDRLARAGKHDEFSAAVEKFRKSKKSRGDEHVLFDEMVRLGVSGEEADEFISIETETG